MKVILSTIVCLNVFVVIGFMSWAIPTQDINEQSDTPPNAKNMIVKDFNMQSLIIDGQDQKHENAKKLSISIAGNESQTKLVKVLLRREFRNMKDIIVVDKQKIKPDYSIDMMIIEEYEKTGKVLDLRAINMNFNRYFDNSILRKHTIPDSWKFINEQTKDLIRLSNIGSFLCTESTYDVIVKDIVEKVVKAIRKEN